MLNFQSCEQELLVKSPVSLKLENRKLLSQNWRSLLKSVVILDELMTTVSKKFVRWKYRELIRICSLTGSCLVNDLEREACPAKLHCSQHQ